MFSRVAAKNSSSSGRGRWKEAARERANEKDEGRRKKEGGRRREDGTEVACGVGGSSRSGATMTQTHCRRHDARRADAVLECFEQPTSFFLLPSIFYLLCPPPA
jgi:hypothetical protein